MDDFIDSSVWIASKFEIGPNAEWAGEYIGKARKIYTSDYIVDEVTAFCLGARELRSKSLRERKQMAKVFLDLFQESGIVEVLPVSNKQFAEAKNLFEHSDLGLSITDWTNLIVARDNSLMGLCTFDRAFRDAVKLPQFGKIRIIPKDEFNE